MINVLIIGAGKLGASLFRAFESLGDLQTFLHDMRPFRDIKSDWIKPSQFYQELDQSSVRSASIIVIAVEDGQIPEVSKKLALFTLDGKIVLHTSGALNSEVLRNLEKRGALTGSLHPMQTFPVPFLAPSIWENTVCSFEGHPRVLQALKPVFEKLGAKILPVNIAQKILIHICGVIVSNYVVGLLAWAEGLLADQDFDSRDIRDIFYPLIHKTVENYQMHPVENILSGPLQRGDVETILKHLDYLNKNAKAKDLELYRNLAQCIVANDKLNIKNRNHLSEIIENYER